MASRKIIKKLAQFALILLLIVMALPAAAFLLLQSNRIQSDLAERVMKMVSEKLDTRFTIGEIEIDFLYRIRLNDVYLEDVTGDTMIYAGTLTAGIRSINPFGKSVNIGSINLDQGIFNLAFDSVKGMNLRYFLDKLKSDGGRKGGWTVDFNNIRLIDTRFSLWNDNYRPKESGMNYSDIRVFNINADIRQFKPSPDSLSFLIKSLSLKEQSGLIIEDMSCFFSESKQFLSFRNLRIKTQESDIRGDEISLRFDSFSKLKGDSFANSVRMRVHLDEAKFDLNDLSYFAPSFRDINQKVTITGLVSGTLDNIRGKNLHIRFGNLSVLSGDLQFQGLPEIRQTFILADINEFTTSAADINALGYFRGNDITLPEITGKLGQITYKGNFTGFINDFVAYGSFRTGLGIIRTDLLFRPDSSNLITFQGKLNAQDFNIGELADARDKMGNISLTATIDGATLEGKSIKASLKGLIAQFELMNYEYTNISLAGDLSGKTFNGSVNVHDPNIDLEFLGKVDFADSIPAFNFTANVTDANPHRLNLGKSDPDLRASFYLIANASGKSLNNINGEVKLLNSLFTKKDKQLQIYDLNIISEARKGFNLLQLRSDFLDADLSGNFELSKSGDIVKDFISEYLPSLLETGPDKKASLRSDIEFKSRIKNIRPLLDFFMPQYELAENSILEFTYHSDSREMRMHFETTYIKANSLLWNNLSVNAYAQDSLLNLEAGSAEFIAGNRLKLENFTATANASSDTTGIQIRWNNWQDIQYKGLFSALATISRPAGSDNPHIAIAIKPSDFYTNDTLWSVHPATVMIDSTSISFDNVSVSHRNQYFRVEGKITENPSDEVHLAFNRFNLANLNSLSATSGYNLGGMLNGNAKLSGIYSTPLFTSILKIDSLVINNEMLGTTEINSSWNNERKSVLLNLTALRDNLRTINIEGEYIPAENGKVDFELELEKLRLNLFNPYVTSIFNDLRGIATGKATLTGTISKPLINGEFNLQKTAFTVDYLKARYNFSHKVQIENNNIYFDDIRIYDPKGNSAYLSGVIRNRYLKDFVLDLNIRAENFLSLNTTLADNKQFYGTAYATGNIKIQGPPKNISMDITATTNKNTSVKIPLSNTGELNEYPYIEVTDRYGISEQKDEVYSYQADLSGIQIRFKLIVTPDAEVQIIMDPVLGEKISGRGTGNLDIRINTRGDFVMIGDYVIEEGDYLFTLQKVINKKLTIEPGGTIRWDGDPLDASIDLIANYRTRASLRDLFGPGFGDEQKIVVDDRVTLTGKLMSPEIKYDIYLPDADETTRLRVNGAMPTSEEKSKQFISLLVTNRFSYAESSGSASTSAYSSAAGVNFSELLSNQLSNWLSQIVNDLDVDVNYRSNRDLNSEELQVALSYQLFNDKLTINGSVGATNAATAASDEIVGEFDIDYKLTDNGKLRLKTFNHANNEMLYDDYSTYTQGLGFTYKEEFNTFGEFLRRLFGKKEESPVPVDESDNEPPVVNNLP